MLKGCYVDTQIRTSCTYKYKPVLTEEKRLVKVEVGIPIQYG